jgi:hypothetical protein
MKVFSILSCALSPAIGYSNKKGAQKRPDLNVV